MAKKMACNRNEEDLKDFERFMKRRAVHNFARIVECGNCKARLDTDDQKTKHNCPSQHPPCWNVQVLSHSSWFVSANQQDFLQDVDDNIKRSISFFFSAFSLTIQIFF